MWFGGCTAGTANRPAARQPAPTFHRTDPRHVANAPAPSRTYTSTFQGGDGNAWTRTTELPGSYVTTPVWGTSGGSCTACHPNVTGTVATGIGLSSDALHGNGVADVSVKWKSNCFGCHQAAGLPPAPRIRLPPCCLLPFGLEGGLMPRTSSREASNLPSLLFAAAGLLLGATLLHDAVDRRILTPDSIFHSPVTAVLSGIGVGMAGVLLWDAFFSRRSR